MTTIQKIKEELRELALTIRKQKRQRKDYDDGYVPGLWANRERFRTRHIAFCEIKGTLRELIEPFAYDDRKPYGFEYGIEAAKQEYLRRMMEYENETLRAST